MSADNYEFPGHSDSYPDAVMNVGTINADPSIRDRISRGGLHPCHGPSGRFRSVGHDRVVPIRGRGTRTDRRNRPSGSNSNHRHGFLVTDFFNPPTTAQQRARQRFMAIVLAFILAILLDIVGR